MLADRICIVAVKRRWEPAEKTAAISRLTRYCWKLHWNCANAMQRFEDWLWRHPQLLLRQPFLTQFRTTRQLSMILKQQRHRKFTKKTDHHIKRQKNLPLINLSALALSRTTKTEVKRKKPAPRTQTKMVMKRAYWRLRKLLMTSCEWTSRESEILFFNKNKCEIAQKDSVSYHGEKRINLRLRSDMDCQRLLANDRTESVALRLKSVSLERRCTKKQRQWVRQVLVRQHKRRR